jgi:hypothetical protein
MEQHFAMKRTKKQNLPHKICLVCQRPFIWRKKWERNWSEVRYCSTACRSKRGTAKNTAEKTGDQSSG